MIIGIPKEIKNHEYRVGATPSLVRALKDAGHEVLVQKNAGSAIGFSDHHYVIAGATIVSTQHEIWQAEMIIKVKEPQLEEFPLMREGQILFCYFHLAPDPEQTALLREKKVVAIAYETVTDKNGRLPLLIPMSEIAGRLSIQVGAHYLQLTEGGKGVLLGGVPGVRNARVVIVGGGIVGTEAARMAMGMGAEVILLDRDLTRLRELDLIFGSCLHTAHASIKSFEEIIPMADLLIGAVHSRGKSAPKIISRHLMSKMEPGSVFVDVAIDQGGCADTSRATSHEEPIYIEEGVTHYCVTNMPGACARTATEALVNATSSYALSLANLGWRKALSEIKDLREGLNVCLGDVTNKEVAQDQNIPYVSCASLGLDKQV